MIKHSFVAPQEMHLELPYSGHEDDYPVPVITALFRNGSYLPLALRMAQERAGEPEKLSVISAACSLGAEADSLLVLNAERGYPGRLAISGYDINPYMVAAAQEGVHTLNGNSYEWPPEQELRSLGFTTGYRETRRALLSRYRLQANAAPLREGHDLTFAEHDVSHDIPLDGPADLILANNLLYHLSAEKAARVLHNLAGTLSENGVLGVGAGTFASDSPLEEERFTRMLDRDWGLTPLYYHSDYAPVLFGRA